ncbi:unnamed protein product [Linum tenue]|uniref:Uncharacterized protein n=1 Tax=Linum tenue TaxID=586396 RepID=A0AAV0RY41_9ROSI|nr:unnamed protein product [Linum tenue]
MSFRVSQEEEEGGIKWEKPARRSDLQLFIYIWVSGVTNKQQ